MLHTYYPSNNNAWDRGYPSGGNYWSDYNGSDVNRDGLGDSPYLVFDNDTDHYPLYAPIASVDIQSPPSPSPSPEPTSTQTSAPSPEPTQSSEPFPKTLVIGSSIVVAVIGFGSLLFFRKSPRDKGSWMRLN